ncbi:MAG: fuculose phosphate aldolase [Gammaproteobacteria bacterium RIFCSPLOWO2_02_FULL_61_13]|nr:MAG: fuculose phosphate aldolase [Gammaproteobacteria bacterium RIFCSPLOWO2_02_FULL_61_13]
MKHPVLRRDIIAAVRSFAGLGLGVGTAGNVSVRAPGGVLITPSGVPYSELRPADIVQLNPAGEVISGRLAPSSEWRFHCDILARRNDVGAIVHAHSAFATAIACTRRDIPAFHYMIAVAGGDSIRCAPYATFGTAALSQHALSALRGRQACLLANHGQIALGSNLTAALAMAQEVEELSRQYWLSKQLRRPVLLAGREMKLVLEKFKNYGRRPVQKRR